MASIEFMKISALKQQPYNKPLVVYVVDVETLSETDRYKYVAAVCDTTDCVKIYLNDKPDINCSYLCFRYVVKSTRTRNVYLTVDKRMPKTESKLPPADIVSSCRSLLKNNSLKRTIIQAKSVTDLSTIVGTVIEDYELKTLTVNGREKTIKKIKIKDQTDDVIVTIWQPQDLNIEVSLGKHIEIKNVSPKKFNGNIELNTTRNSAIKQVEAPTSSITGVVVAYTTSTIVMNVSEELLEYDLEEQTMPKEDILKNYIRHKTYITIKVINNKIVKIEEIEFPDISEEASWSEPI